MPQPSISIIVCEKTGAWACWLRRLADQSELAVSLSETRSLGECWDEVERQPTSLLVLELTARNCERVPWTLSQVGLKLPLVRAVVVGERSFAAWDRLLREAGAVHTVFSKRNLPAVVKIARRHALTLPTPELDMRQLAWSRLPWGDGLRDIRPELE